MPKAWTNFHESLRVFGLETKKNHSIRFSLDLNQQKIALLREGSSEGLVRTFAIALLT